MSGNLQTKDVSITTLSVTIKALHIDSRRMTLATFKQLPTGNLYDDYGSIFEDISVWGYVRYVINDVPLWAVFDCLGKLYRADIKKRLISSNISSYQRDICRYKKHIEELTIKINDKKAELARNIEQGREWCIKSDEQNILDNKREVNSYIDEIPRAIKSLEVCQSMKKSSEEILDLQQLFIAL
jgi:hypothetical protein